MLFIKLASSYVNEVELEVYIVCFASVDEVYETSSWEFHTAGGGSRLMIGRAPNMLTKHEIY